MPKELNFKVSSALKSVIGRDLITNDFVAIFELVKNSFDAGSTKVDIIFDFSNKIDPKIYVVDDGKGMSYSDITEKWLFVAYSAKQDGTEDSSKGRTYAGNKGVGRFSCDRLGGKLKLQTRTESLGAVDFLEVDWGRFEKNSKTIFEKIKISHDEIDDFLLPPEKRALDHGVILEMSDLRQPESWDRNKLLRLKSHLTKLIDPFGDASSSFDIRLHCTRELKQDKKEEEKANEKDFVDVVNGSIRNRIFETLRNKTTSIEVSLNSDGYFYSSLVDRGELIYKIKESAEKFPELKGSDFNCQLFYLNKSAKSTFTRRMSLASTKFGSLFLFRNGFRVFPVGEVGDDTWEIDLRRQQGYARYFGTRDIMGRVDIFGPEEKFKEASSRDKGLIETVAAKQLNDCVWDYCIKRLENYVVGVTWKDKLDKLHDTSKRMGLDENRTRIIDLVGSLSRSDSIELIEYNDNLVGVLSEKSAYFEESLIKLEGLADGTDNTDLKSSIESARKRFIELKNAEEEALRLADQEADARRKAEIGALKEKEQRLQAEVKADVAQKEFEEEKKRNLFLVATESRDKEQLESFLHQIVIYASSSKQKISSSLKKIYSGDNKYSLEEASQTLSELLEISEKLITTSRFATFANFKLDSAEIEDDICLYIEQYLEKVSTAYNHRINISSTLNSKPFVIGFTPIELGMVLDNLVNNSKKSRASQVIFEINQPESSVLEVVVEDNGRGLDRSISEPDRVFEKGFTKTRGSGLGLYHSRKQVERMGGELVVSEDQPLKGFKLVMRFRKS